VGAANAYSSSLANIGNNALLQSYFSSFNPQG
jgi:hypothetical protein